jgi:hypothetical protein
MNSSTSPETKKSVLSLPVIVCLAFLMQASSLYSGEVNLIQNPDFERGSNGVPENYDLKGSAVWGRVGGNDEFTSFGILFPSNKSGGGVSQMVTAIDQSKGKWLTFRFRGFPENEFLVPENGLAMKIEFYSHGGTNSLDGITRLIMHEITRDRDTLSVNGNHGRDGGAVWRSYELEELIPFKEVDAVKVSLVYTNGKSTSLQHSSFLIDDFSLVQRTNSLTGKIDPSTGQQQASNSTPPDHSKLIPLGGRWYYDPLPSEQSQFRQAGSNPVVTVTEENADRLFYKSDRLINPFKNNMTAWLLPGYKDLKGKIVTQREFVPDNVVLMFKGDGYLTMKTKNIPNHPTAKFPDTYGTQGYNPNYIQELDKTYRLPLDPVPDPNAKAMTAHDQNHALPMGAIGVAVNGVVFYNPFDAEMQDASSIMDRCCGHPSPDNRYHYHKYPVCVNTPFVDKGDGPSQVIGFAFDGFPIYGPYEEAGIMARDLTSNPLNPFNAHDDPVRGWHYHVTPGKFPYIIGGYFGKVDSSNLESHPMPAPGSSSQMPRFGPPGGGPPPRPPRF